MSEAAAPATVGLHGLSKRFGEVTAVDGVDLVVRGGEFMTFLGPSGSGKTTTLKMVAGFIEQSRGRIEIDGETVSAPPHKRDIGMVFQNYALFPHMTAAHNIAFPLTMRRVPAAEREKRVREALELVHLGELADRYPKQLSGGQQQRVALARALVFRPRVVLMDEPLGALDKKLREYLQLEIRQIQQDLNLTMIYVTHDQEEALVMSDRITVFNLGRIEQVGSGEELYETPGSRFVADFIGESNIFEGAITDTGFETQGRRFSLARRHGATGPAALVVRPERLHLFASEDAVPAGHNRFEAQVRNIVYLGSERKYEIQTPDGTVLIARHQVGVVAHHAIAVGDGVWAAWHVDHGILVSR